MTQMVFVTPAEGARVRMPERNSTVMAAAGSWVPRTVHYERLIRVGDVIVADPQPPMPGAPEPPPSKPPHHRAQKET
ncbi:DUF2635 domain-containing protein [Rhodopseudomonas sp. HC1]|uniref:DUF2635 domain-containing protein n=1 Tax=Rhodopseudomonas infernalis TaxID=2897386 RepID=UPI001EE8C427|nr:DUF2635 domain-containing protein [Rhodopseudomonas infernalis]MCG6204196.1 DUF2635 domain-containing protein [Rhodopseudomonas infernalis]